MSCLSVLPKEKLTLEFAKMTETTKETGNGTVFQVLGHRADMFESYFKFSYSTHEDGVVQLLKNSRCCGSTSSTIA